MSDSKDSPQVLEATWQTVSQWAQDHIEQKGCRAGRDWPDCTTYEHIAREINAITAALQSRLTAALEVVRVERARHFPETHNVTGRPFTVCVVCSDVQDAPWPCDPAQAMDKVLEG